MKYLCAIFIPPLYFLVRRKWGQFIVNSILYGIACMLVLSIAFIFIAPLFWLMAVVHAFFNLRREMTVENAELLATKMAEKMRETKA